MTREEIIQGLQFTIDMFLSDPNTGETFKEPRNDMDKTTIDACKGAIELLEQQPCEDAISREEAIGAVANLFEMSEYPHPYPQGKPIRLKDIKEKLKQLPPVQPKPIECEDTISRKDALKALDYDIKSFEFKSGVGRHMNEIANLLNTIYEIQSDNIKALPSVQPKIKTEHWIPVSERLPEYGKEVLTCSNGGFIEIQSLEDGGYWENQKGDWTDFDEVIAWMPLPEPYKPQESEDKE